jgi:uncharacterized membrane protein
MDSTKSDEKSADDIKLKNDLFNLVEKLQIELRKKDEELTKEKQEKQVCKAFLLFASLYINECLFAQKLSADLELEKVRTNGTTTELSRAEEMNAALQLILW